MQSSQSVLSRYHQLVRTCIVSEWGAAEADVIAKKILQNKNRYIGVQKLSGVHWQFVGALHHLECGGDFDAHLANGDPISGATYHEPVGIPAGNWESCAVAALALKGWTKDADLDWLDYVSLLDCAETYNGRGYENYHPTVNTPYLWSGTNHYTCGKYVEDGLWDDDFISEQVGLHPIFAALWSAENNSSKVTIKEVPKMEALKNPLLFFSMALDESPSLNKGRLFLIDQELGIVGRWVATSGLGAYQGAGDYSKQGGGCIPPTYNLSEPIPFYKVAAAPVDLRHIKGVEGNGYAITPFMVTTADGVERGDLLIHLDANMPGTLGCIGIIGESEFADFEAVFNARCPSGEIKLLVGYTY
jgi:lysozyme family protein